MPCRRRSRLPALAAAVALGAAAAVPATAAATAAPGACASAEVVVSATTTHLAQATLCLLNRERSRRGLRPLRLNARLGKAALAHSRDMVRRGYFAHDAPHGSSWARRLLSAHYVPSGTGYLLGENLGWGTGDLSTPTAIVRAWMHSPPHRRNILDGRFREIGIGITAGVPMADAGDLADEGAGTYTTDFGRVG